MALGVLILGVFAYMVKAVLDLQAAISGSVKRMEEKLD